MTESKMGGFRQWKKGKHWLYGASVLLALTGTVLLTLSLSMPVIAVTNGNIVLYNGIITNTGAVEAGNPQGRVFCIDVATSLESGATSNLSETGASAAGLTWAMLNATQRAQIQTIGWLAFNNARSSAASDNNLYLAAQELIWDVTTGHGLPSKASESFYGAGHMDVPEDEAWYEGTPNYVPAMMMADMDFLLVQYQNFLKVPQFSTNTQTLPLGKSATFTDANQVLGHYASLQATNGLKVSVSGNILTVTPTQAGTGTVSLSNGGVSETDGTANSGGVHVWFTNDPDGKAGQNLIFAEKAPNQSVQVSVTAVPPAIETEASDGSDGDHKLGVGTIMAQDTSKIKNLVAGNYTEVTHWVEAETGTALIVNGKPLVTTQDFTSIGNGEDQVTSKVQFTDAALQGKSITAEEFVYPKGKISGVPVVFEDHYKGNASQSLTISKGEGETQVEKALLATGKVTFSDHYSGSGFEAGQKVVVKVDSVFDHTLNKEVPASGNSTFTADKNGHVSGTIQVTLDATKLAGDDVTVFESTWVDSQLVFQLHDKAAVAETVQVSSPAPTSSSAPAIPSTPSSSSNPKSSTPPTAPLPHTGDRATGFLVWVGTGLLAFGVGLVERHHVAALFTYLVSKVRRK
ncbi:MAG: VaFE repeat-containing surface-anchored protein [Streptococcaceae bacterium]|nr:VaFE repeat-containing surface-anchored protein [Streptococcaceae bacterium]